VNEHIFFFRDDDDDDDDEYDNGEEEAFPSLQVVLKFPNSLSAEDRLFSFEYNFPVHYSGLVEDIEENGLIIGDFYRVSPKYAFDALKCGMVVPLIEEINSYDDMIHFEYWSPLEGRYKNFYDMVFVEKYWMFSALSERIWSYN